MRRALFISTFYYLPDDQSVHGVFRRLDIHLAALCSVADEVDMLFLMSATKRYSPEVVAEHQERLQRRWSTKVRLYLEPVVAPDRRRGRLDFVRGVFDFSAQTLPSFPSGIHCEAVQQALRRALERDPDVIFAHRMGVMSALAKLPAGVLHAPVIFDMDDIEHVAHGRRVLQAPEWPMQRLQALHVPAILLEERRVARLAAATLVCSLEDQRHMEKLTRLRSFRVIRNAVSIPTQVTAADTAGEPVAVFVGMLSYRPNVAAADLLAREIWPRVRQRLPGAQLRIVGKRPESVPAYSNPPPGVTFTGFVPDIADVYRDARIVCCPITFGSGTRVKIVEAAAYGRAVVSTAIGAEGLEFEDGKEIVVRNDVESFAGACVQLLQSPVDAMRFGQAARAKAKSLYGQEAVVSALVRILEDIRSAPAACRS